MVGEEKADFSFIFHLLFGSLCSKGFVFLWMPEIDCVI